MTQSGDTALMWAIKDGRTEVILQLIMAGANINLFNKVDIMSKEEVSIY